MTVLSWIKFLAGAFFILAGLVVFVIQLIGVFRFRYVLNRMHAAAMGDTLGVGLVLLGVLILNGLTMASLKIGFIIVFLWFTSPVASHVVTNLEVMSREKPEECCPVKDLHEEDEQS
ncbi:cation:proton antiporter [Hespellia stercorisuis]|uniref:Multicomponent Na+:H+ antiporter subunit G n=1 Tax=Hespellia stercorisuis DSM 15480 TaxID=1121950 RepID=A0A1M6HKS8_9FIRM|nr:monovalent cation/H(+) antiporter subunit G [Hespellia stercorisuis]SHJ22772.1 multicomponent Na+:H+ antiporter subunit G [Hespellia stercorisuis DSM 15480]